MKYFQKPILCIFIGLFYMCVANSVEIGRVVFSIILSKDMYTYIQTFCKGALLELKGVGSKTEISTRTSTFVYTITVLLLYYNFIFKK